MGSGASTVDGSLLNAEIKKAQDASDVESLEDAKAELVRVRGLLKQIAEQSIPENSPFFIQDTIDASAQEWKALNGKYERGNDVSSFRLGFIADQDEASKVEGGWETAFAIGTLTFTPAEKGEGRDCYSFKMDDYGDDIGNKMVTKRGDKRQRGAEYVQAFEMPRSKQSLTSCTSCSCFPLSPR